MNSNGTQGRWNVNLVRPGGRWCYRATKKILKSEYLNDQSSHEKEEINQARELLKSSSGKNIETNDFQRKKGGKRVDPMMTVVAKS